MCACVCVCVCACVCVCVCAPLSLSHYTHTHTHTHTLQHLKKEHDALESGVERVEFSDTAPRRQTRAKSAKHDAPPPAPKEYTFAMIKPTAVANGHADAIFARIAEEGLKVVTSSELTLDAQRAGEFYKEHEGKEFYERLVAYMSSGGIVAMVLSGEDTIKKWRALIGPTNLEKARAEAPNR